MDHEQLIKTLRKEQMPEVPDRLWYRIEQTLQEKASRQFHWNIFSIMPTAALAGAVAVFIGVFTLNYVHNAQIVSYVKMLGSTEYIYEGCKYPG